MCTNNKNTGVYDFYYFYYISYMRKTISLNSIFSYIPVKPLIHSYGNYLLYCQQNHLSTSRHTRQIALRMYFQHIKNH